MPRLIQNLKAYGGQAVLESKDFILHDLWGDCYISRIQNDRVTDGILVSGVEEDAPKFTEEKVEAFMLRHGASQAEASLFSSKCW